VKNKIEEYRLAKQDRRIKEIDERLARLQSEKLKEQEENIKPVDDNTKDEKLEKIRLEEQIIMENELRRKAEAKRIETENLNRKKETERLKQVEEEQLKEAERERKKVEEKQQREEEKMRKLEEKRVKKEEDRLKKEQEQERLKKEKVAERLKKENDRMKMAEERLKHEEEKKRLKTETDKELSKEKDLRTMTYAEQMNGETLKPTQGKANDGQSTFVSEIDIGTLLIHENHEDIVRATNNTGISNTSRGIQKTILNTDQTQSVKLITTKTSETSTEKLPANTPLTPKEEPSPRPLQASNSVVSLSSGTSSDRATARLHDVKSSQSDTQKSTVTSTRRSVEIKDNVYEHCDKRHRTWMMECHRWRSAK